MFHYCSLRFSSRSFLSSFSSFQIPPSQMMCYTFTVMRTSCKLGNLSPSVMFIWWCYYLSLFSSNTLYSISNYAAYIPTKMYAISIHHETAIGSGWLSDGRSTKVPIIPKFGIRVGEIDDLGYNHTMAWGPGPDSGATCNFNSSNTVVSRMANIIS